MKRAEFNREILQIYENGLEIIPDFACLAYFAVAFFSFNCFRTGYFSAMESEPIYKEESYKIVGACFEVYKEKGCGFVEYVYQECMHIELRLQGIPFVPKKSLALEYKGTPLIAAYEPDFICYDKIILELKAVKELCDEHRAQVQNYLKATRFTLGLLVNFGHYPKIEIERIVNTRGRLYGKRI